MRELRDRAGLAVEALAELRIGGEGFGKNLDRDGAIEPRVAGLVHLAHAAGTNRGEDFIGPETSSEGQRHGLGVYFFLFSRGPTPAR